MELFALILDLMTNNDDGIFNFVTCLDCPEVSKDIHLKRLDNPDQNNSYYCLIVIVIAFLLLLTGFNFISFNK